jgi:hypothetical protein
VKGEHGGWRGDEWSEVTGGTQARLALVAAGSVQWRRRGRRRMSRRGASAGPVRMRWRGRLRAAARRSETKSRTHPVSTGQEDRTDSGGRWSRAWAVEASSFKLRASSPSLCGRQGREPGSGQSLLLQRSALALLPFGSREGFQMKGWPQKNPVKPNDERDGGRRRDASRRHTRVATIRGARSRRQQVSSLR